MPTYGYECTSCRHEIEVFQSIKDDPLTICEQCGGALRKRIYPVGIAFKGSGFYVNDYARKSESAPAEAKAGDAKTETGETAKAEPAKSEGAKADAPKPDAKPTAPAAV